MTTKEFASRMRQVNENVTYFSLLGYHCYSTFDIKTDMCELTVFFDDSDDRDMILEHSSLELVSEGNNETKYVTLR